MPIALGELASVVRSKNAGPFQITIDVMFASERDYRRVLGSGVINAAMVAARYRIPASEVDIVPFDRVWAIKITIPRRFASRGSGSAADRDVYGAQQHGPLVDVLVE